MVAAITVLVAFSAGMPATAQTAPVMASPAPPPGTVGSQYFHQFTAGPLDLVFAVAAGTLAPGLHLTPQGFLNGVPNTAGTFGPASICATSGRFSPACQDITLVIARRSGDLFVSPSRESRSGRRCGPQRPLLGSFVPTGTLTFRLFYGQSCANEVFVSEKVPVLHAGPRRRTTCPPCLGHTGGPCPTAKTATTSRCRSRAMQPAQLSSRGRRR